MLSSCRYWYCPYAQFSDRTPGLCVFVLVKALLDRELKLPILYWIQTINMGRVVITLTIWTLVTFLCLFANTICRSRFIYSDAWGEKWLFTLLILVEICWHNGECGVYYAFPLLLFAVFSEQITLNVPDTWQIVCIQYKIGSFNSLSSSAFTNTNTHSPGVLSENCA
jgi:hypothetical protein